MPTATLHRTLIYKVLQFGDYIVPHLQWSEFKTPKNPAPSSPAITVLS